MYSDSQYAGINLVKWIVVFSGCFFFTLLNASAMPALDQPFTITQPDGTVIVAQTKGDEWRNWTENASGFPIAKGPNNYWYIVQSFMGNNPVLSGIRADYPVAPSFMKQARPGFVSMAAAPFAPAQGAVGQPNQVGPVGKFRGNVLFILVQFKNQKHKTAPAAWAAKIKEINKFYRTVSYRAVNLRPARETSGRRNDGVVGWLTLGMRHPNTRGNTGRKNQLLAKKAILAANRFVNFAAYDKNRDGFVDSNELAIVVIAAGYEAAYSNVRNSVWGHAWAISMVAPPVVDGVKVGAWTGLQGYAQFGELHGTKKANHLATLGIMVHELGHLIFAWPDLYDYDGSSSGIGAFGLMSSGSWGMKSTDQWSGMTPVSPIAWSKLQRGWVKSARIVKGKTRRLIAGGAPTANKSNTVLQAGISANKKEYFLFENRQDMGYDKGLERWFGAGFTGGIAIYHVDDTRTLNTNDRHRWVDVEEADGTPMGLTLGSVTDFWSKNVATTFNARTTPNSKYYNRRNSGVSVINISPPGRKMTLFFK